MKNYFKTYLLIAFCIGVIVGYLFATVLIFFTDKDNTAHTTYVKPVQTEKQMAAIQVQYEQKLQVLSRRNDSLTTQLSQKKLSLRKSSDKVLVLQTQVEDLMNDYAAIDSAATETVDSAALISNCEEMQERVKDLIGETEVKDSIAYSVINTLEDEIKNKDSTIDLHKFQYQLTKSKLSDMRFNQQVLQDDNNKLRKQIKRKKVGNFLLKTGMLILSGITLKSVIH
jgi:hypothetical protein